MVGPLVALRLRLSWRRERRLPIRRLNRPDGLLLGGSHINTRHQCQERGKG
jgi:hypothetical protein